MNVTVLVDASGSMSVLGKEAICESLIQTLTLLTKLSPPYKDWTFDFQNWNKDTRELKDSSEEKYIVFTDGFDIENIENRNVSVVLVGEDSPDVSKVNYFKAIDILNAVDFLRDNND